jgi:hypothetical protein
MALLPRQIDHARAITTASEAHIGHQSLSRTVDHAANDRKGHGSFDMLKPAFQRLNCFYDVKTLSRAAWARDDIHPAMAQAQ